uniref:EF-hand domain-containing protein n=1 Tax=Tetraselmis sp. GSL018 TaxID=582737 RepID=A0A061REL3_9CHLO|mmetsp:Transcript_37807/g.89775  ORF Transcript_37807/g.89775 Transcript_37807/m.89775 type:complete len:285 (+) Transcript_37807:324-1178(+)
MNTGDRLPPRLISMSWYCVSPLQVKDQMYLLDVFQLIDTKSDGYITSDELFRAFRIVGSEVELDTLDSWLTSCTPRRRPGKLSRKEFLELVVTYSRSRSAQQLWPPLNALYDSKGASQLRAVSGHSGAQLTNGRSALGELLKGNFKQQNRWELASWNTSRVGGRLNGNSGLAQQVGTQSAEGKSSEYVYDTSHHHPRNVVDTTSTSCCSSQYFKEGRISDATSDSEEPQIRTLRRMPAKGTASAHFQLKGADNGECEIETSQTSQVNLYSMKHGLLDSVLDGYG